ncbi:MAG TPA: tetraacyldisaccharide 4'-kinase [Nitrospira sp.]|nr:tetraacyldisaccharide 4'-kinase [Nitrospira sp.]
MAWLNPGQPVRTELGWVAWFYGLIIRFRLWCYRRGWWASTRLPCRVISVGNLTVGGTGKTPMVILVTEWLLAKGLRVAVLSRGYRRTSTAPHLLVSDGSRVLVGPSEAGDEPHFIAQRCPKAIVAVGADRVLLGRWVLGQYPADCIVLDDGFQHRALQRDVDLVLLDATDATGLDALLPAGRLREPLSELARASAVAITRADSQSDLKAVYDRLQAVGYPSGDVIEVVFTPECVVAVVSQERQSLEWGRTKRAWLVSGIGNSPSFRLSAESIGVEVVGETAFADHHGYSHHDVQHIHANAKANGVDFILTTEKDAGKLSSLLGPNDPWWALRLQAKITRGEASLRRLIDSPLPDQAALGARA